MPTPVTHPKIGDKVVKGRDWSYPDHQCEGAEYGVVVKLRDITDPFDVSVVWFDALRKRAYSKICKYRTNPERSDLYYYEPTPVLVYGGQLQGFPVEIVQKMLERQFEQTGARDVTVFERYKIASGNRGGVTWSNTPEGHDFWSNIIEHGDFGTFWEMYPRNIILSTNNNKDENTKDENTSAIKVQKPEATIVPGERISGCAISGRRNGTATGSRYLGHKAVKGL